MSDSAFTRNYLDDLASILHQLDENRIATAIQWMREARDNDQMIYICGNGGSASIASQMVVDIVKGASYGKKKRFKMMSFTDSPATMTAYANDVSYDVVFAEPLKNFARPGDLLIGVSGSGNSKNVVEAFAYAKEAGVKTIAMTTDQGGKLKDMADLLLGVPSDHMGRLEDAFFIMTHVLCYIFMEAD